jgi:isocitrate dehydrogenase kinase/phosphatase
LLEPGFWRARQARIREGVLEDVFPYPAALRFRHLPDPDIPNQENLE